MSITVLLVDDHRMMRDGLRMILEMSADIKVIGEAENGRDALEMLKQIQPDVVVMDIAMQEINGIDATRMALRICPKTRLIGLSTYTDRSYVMSMLGAGASGYVPKSSAADQLVTAIQTVVKGQIYLEPDLAKPAIEKFVQQMETGSPVAPTTGGLGPREREVLQLIAEGNTSKAIGERLGISAKTVEVHRQNIMNKLDLHSIANLTKYAVREGLTHLET